MVCRPMVSNGSCNLMWIAERPGSAEWKRGVEAPNLGVETGTLRENQETKQCRTLIRIIKNIENWTPFAPYILQLSFSAVLLTNRQFGI